MAESATHANLVESMRQWVIDNCFDEDSGFVLVDNPEGTRFTKPPNTYGFVPDLFARRKSEGGIIIGEAKTVRDLENPHTRAQLTAFLKRCSEEMNSMLVLAVPWHMERFAKNLVRSISHQESHCGVEVVILNRLQG